MTGKVCKCGETVCIVVLYSKGKQYKYRRDSDGDVLGYVKAEKLLAALQTRVDEEKDAFNPRDRLDTAMKERLFENRWDEFIKEKVEAMQEGEKSPEYVRVLKCFRSRYFTCLEGYDVRNINKELLSKVKKGLKGKKVKTKKNVMNALVHFFHWLIDEGTVKTKPQFPEIDGEDATPQVAVDYGTQQEALQRIPQPYRDVIEFGMELGLRPGETCALKVKDIDLKEGIANIHRTWSGSVLRPTTKGKHKDGVPISDRAIDIAYEHCKGKMPEQWLFVNPKTTGPFRRKRLGEVWNQYAGVPVKHYEASRHSFCTQIVESGASLEEARLLMRHTDIRSTQNYFHGRKERLRQFVNRRGKVLPMDRHEIGTSLENKK